uniref:Uncharacterized protein n=1 Tax=Anopheles atroparvus TaxID=41427 RepID=A0AAG5CUR6_ANOAO
MVNDSNDPDLPSTTLQDDTFPILALQRWLLRVVDVRHHHRTVDHFQKGHQSGYTMLELVIPERHHVCRQHVQEVRRHVPPQQRVPECTLEVVTGVQIDWVPIGILLSEGLHARYNPCVPSDAPFALFRFAACRKEVGLLEARVEVVQVNERERKQIVLLRNKHTRVGNGGLGLPRARHSQHTDGYQRPPMGHLFSSIAPELLRDLSSQAPTNPDGSCSFFHNHQSNIPDDVLDKKPAMRPEKAMLSQPHELQ